MIESALPAAFVVLILSASIAIAVAPHLWYLQSKREDRKLRGDEALLRKIDDLEERILLWKAACEKLQRKYDNEVQKKGNATKRSGG